MKNMEMEQEANQQRLAGIVQPLLEWYRKQARILPWRENPEPYRVWVSEIMLQQTRVEAVKPYFDRFLQALPTVKDLAECSGEQLMKLWEGLGYYSRARNLKKAAQAVQEQFGGEIPSTYEELISLPGIGDYTAGAIASIAFGKPIPAVDGNVLRVLSRILACGEDVTQKPVKDAFRRMVTKIEPVDAAGDFNQALMELGAMVCLPNGQPQCLCCPLSGQCVGYQEGSAMSFPVKPAKKARKVEERTVFLLMEKSGTSPRVLLHQRPDKGLLAGLWEFPSLPGNLSADSAWEQVTTLVGELAILKNSIKPLGKAKHIFSHIEWHMVGFLLLVSSGEQVALPDGYIWADADSLNHVYTLPSAFKAYNQLLPDIFASANSTL